MQKQKSLLSTSQSNASPFGVTETQVNLNLDTVMMFEDKKGNKQEKAKKLNKSEIPISSIDAYEKWKARRSSSAINEARQKVKERLKTLEQNEQSSLDQSKPEEQTEPEQKSVHIARVTQKRVNNKRGPSSRTSSRTFNMINQVSRSTAALNNLLQPTAQLIKPKRPQTGSIHNAIDLMRHRSQTDLGLEVNPQEQKNRQLLEMITQNSARIQTETSFDNLRIPTVTGPHLLENKDNRQKTPKELPRKFKPTSETRNFISNFSVSNGVYSKGATFVPNRRKPSESIKNLQTYANEGSIESHQDSAIKTVQMHELRKQAKIVTSMSKKEREAERDQIAFLLPLTHRDPTLTHDEQVHRSMILDEVNKFNSSAPQYKSFLMQSETLLFAIQNNASLIETKDPHYFQTVLSCSLLDKIVDTLLPSFGNVLKPVCNFIYRAIFKNFPTLETMEKLEKPQNNDISSYPFIYYKMYADNERLLLQHHRENKAKLAKFDIFEKKNEQFESIQNNLLRGMKKYTGKELKKKVFDAIHKEAEENKLGAHAVQRDYVVQKKVIAEKREQRIQIFNKWQVFSHNRRMVAQQTEIERLVLRCDQFATDQQSLLGQIAELKRTIKGLNEDIRDRDDKILKQKKKIDEASHRENKILPKIVGNTIQSYYKLFSDLPVIQRLKGQGLKFKQLDTLISEQVTPISNTSSRRMALKRQGSETSILPEFLTQPRMIEKTIFDLPKQMPTLWISQPQKKANYVWFCQHLLRKNERIDQGGQGINELFKSSLDDILYRWQYMMIEKALFKLQPIIEILETQLYDLKEPPIIKQKAAYQMFLKPKHDNFYVARDGLGAEQSDKASLSEGIELYKQANPLINNGNNRELLNVYTKEINYGAVFKVSEAKDLYDELMKLYKLLKSYVLEYREKGKTQAEKDEDVVQARFQERKSPRNNTPEKLHLPKMLLAIIVVLTKDFKLVQLSENSVSTEIWKEVLPVNPNGNSFAKREKGIYTDQTIDHLVTDMFERQCCSIIPSKYQPSSRIFQIPNLSLLTRFFKLMHQTEHDEEPGSEQEKEPQTVQISRRMTAINNRRTKSLSPIQKSKSQQQSAQDRQLTQNIAQMQIKLKDQQSMYDAELIQAQFKYIVKKAEQVTQTKIAFYISPDELMSSQTRMEQSKAGLFTENLTSSVSNFLAFLFLSRSKLDIPFSYNTQMPTHIRDKFSSVQSYANACQADYASSEKLFAKLMYSISQVNYPVIVRTVHANMQDLMLLFTKKELKSFNRNREKAIKEDEDSNEEEMDLSELKIVQRPIGELKLRWVNFILRTAYEAMQNREKNAIKQLAQIEAQQSSFHGSPYNSKQNLKKDGKFKSSLKKKLEKKAAKMQLNLNIPEGSSRAYETTLKFKPLYSLDQLGSNLNGYNYLVALLGTLSPESVWSFFGMDQVALDHNLDIMLLLVTLLDYEYSACAKIVNYELQKQKENFDQKLKKRHEEEKQSEKQIGIDHMNSNELIKQKIKDMRTQTQVLYNFITKNSVFGLRNINQGIRSEMRYIFMINSVFRITNKNYLVSFDNLLKSDLKGHQLNLLVTELFTSRPRLNTHHSQSSSQYRKHSNEVTDFLTDQQLFMESHFTSNSVEMLPHLISKMGKEHPQVINAMQYTHKCAKMFQKVIDRFRADHAEGGASLTQMASIAGLLRSHAYFCRLETALSTIDYDLVMHLCKFNSRQHAMVWCYKIQEAMIIFKNPIRRLMNFLADKNCMISYKAIWRLLKSINVMALNPLSSKYFKMKSKRVEHMLIKTAKFTYNRNKVKEEEEEVDQTQIIQMRKTVSLPQTFANQSGMKLSMAQGSLKANLLQKVGAASGLSMNQPININSKFLPTDKAQQDILFDRRLMYAMSLTVRETFAVLICFIYELNLHDILEVMFGGKNQGPQSQQESVLLFQKEYEAKKSILENEDILTALSDLSPSFVSNRHAVSQKIQIETITGKNLDQIKAQISGSQDKSAALLRLLSQKIMGESDTSNPQVVFVQVLIKCLLNRDSRMLNCANRHALMAKESMATLIDFYNPMLIALFEYYLYDSYQNDQIGLLGDSCLPCNAIFSFYLDFGSGESARLNKTTMLETLRNVLHIDPDIKFDDIDEKKGKGQVKRTQTSPRKGQEQELMSTNDLKFNYFDFLEIIFEMSQEIDVNRNVSTEMKFKTYIENVILLNIRYRLDLKSHGGNLHKARLFAELERVKPCQNLRSAIQAASVANNLI